MNKKTINIYEEYKKAKQNGVSNKEIYKLLANPADVNGFLRLLKGKKDLNKVKLELSNKK